MQNVNKLWDRTRQKFTMSLIKDADCYVLLPLFKYLAPTANRPHELEYPRAATAGQPGVVVKVLPVAVLGSGAFGIVFRAVALSDARRIFALKRIR